MSDFNVTAAVDAILEGKSIGDVLKHPHVATIEGKILGGISCSGCGEIDHMIVKEVSSYDQGFYTCIAECEQCGDVVELEVVLQDEAKISMVKENVVGFDGGVYIPISEGGLMNGNYLKFNSGLKAYVVSAENGKDFNIFFNENGVPDPDEAYVLNTRVTFKVISFRNGQAKLVSMVNDNANKLKAGTTFYADQRELQKYAKMAAPKSNPAMNGKFKY